MPCKLTFELGKLISHTSQYTEWAGCCWCSSGHGPGGGTPGWSNIGRWNHRNTSRRPSLYLLALQTHKLNIASLYFPWNEYIRCTSSYTLGGLFIKLILLIAVPTSTVWLTSFRLAASVNIWWSRLVQEARSGWSRWSPPSLWFQAARPGPPLLPTLIAILWWTTQQTGASWLIWVIQLILCSLIMSCIRVGVPGSWSLWCILGIWVMWRSTSVRWWRTWGLNISHQALLLIWRLPGKARVPVSASFLIIRRISTILLWISLVVVVRII